MDIYNSRGQIIGQCIVRPQDLTNSVQSELSELSEDIDWTTVCIECEGHGQEVAEWVLAKTPDIPRPWYHNRLCNWADAVVIGWSGGILSYCTTSYETSVFNDPRILRMSYEEWRQHAYPQETEVVLPPAEPALTPEEMDFDQLTEWARHNRDKVGIKAPWQAKEEAELALIAEVMASNDIGGTLC